mgnify:FL=1
MKRKKVTSLLALMMAGVLAAGMAGCGGSGNGDSAEASASSESGDSGDKSTVTIWATGSDNVRQVYEALIEDFNSNSDYADQYTAELQFMLSGTGTQSMTDMLAAAYQANQTNTDYDLVDVGGDDLSALISRVGEEAFVKLDDSKIPNAERVSAESSLAADYVQPYRGTTVILAYDSEAVPNPPTTMDELVEWMKEHPGRFAYNAPGTGGAGDSFARTSIYNFLQAEAMTSDDPSWEDQWDEGFQFLTDIHQYMYTSGGSIVYPNKNQGTLDLLNQGEIDMCPNWADMVLSQRADGTLKDTIKITQIDPAFTGSLQSLAIPTFGSNEDGAYAFIDYMLTDSAQEILVKEMAAIPLVDTSNIDMTGYEDVMNLDVSNFRIMSIGDLGTDFNARWDSEIGTLG